MCTIATYLVIVCVELYVVGLRKFHTSVAIGIRMNVFLDLRRFPLFPCGEKQLSGVCYITACYTQLAQFLELAPITVFAQSLGGVLDT